MNYQEIIARVIADPADITLNDRLACQQDGVLSGPIWAIDEDNKLNLEATIRKLTDPRLNSRTHWNGFAFKTFAEVFSEKNRYLPGSPNPLVEGDHGADLTDEELILIHFAHANGVIPDVWQAVKDMQTGNTERIANAKRELKRIQATDPAAYASWTAAIYRPSAAAIANTMVVSGGAMSLRDALNNRFNMSDLEDVCFQLGVNHEDIGGESKPGFVIRMISHFERRGKSADLLALVKRLRPNLQLAA